jgi:hypothetical protein
VDINGNLLTGPYELSEVFYLHFLMEEEVAAGGCTIGNTTICALCMMEHLLSLLRSLDRTYRQVLWSLRSPNLIPGNFYLWGNLKGLVYSKRVSMQDKLWCLIPETVTTIQHMPKMFRTQDSVMH